MTPRPQPSPAERLRSQVKTMALLCALLGPTLGAMTLLAYGTRRMVDAMLSSGLVPTQTFDTYQRVSLDFGVRSAIVSIPLGTVLLVAGVRAFRDLRRGREALVVAAAVSIAAMLAYGALWSWVVELQDAGVGAHFAGWLLHLAQAGLVVGALRFLLRPDVRDACSGS